MCSGILIAEAGDLKLWYKQPAQEWVEALPLGNGRLGAMVFGNPDGETIALNHDTLWSGRPNNRLNPAVRDALPETILRSFALKD